MSPLDAPHLSLNARAATLADAMAAAAPRLRIGRGQGAGGETLIDCGHRHPGSLEAGRQLARICLGGLAEVAVLPSDDRALPGRVSVRTGQPVLACLGSQYAGWHLRSDSGIPLMGSGPARALARAEPVFDGIAHREEEADRAVLVLEGEEAPGEAAASAVAESCGLPRHRLTLLHAPTGSLAGAVQIAARVVECALQKARALRLDLETVVAARGTAPLAPPHPDMATAMGRSNDAIIYGGRVHLDVTGPEDEARELALALPSRTAPDWGRSFAAVYAEAGGDFARIDPGLFSPAEIGVTALETGRTFRAGQVDPDRLRAVLRPA